MGISEKQTAHLILSHQPQRVLLVDSNPALEESIHALLRREPQGPGNEAQENASSGIGAEKPDSAAPIKLTRLGPDSLLRLADRVDGADRADGADGADIAAANDRPDAATASPARPLHDFARRLLDVPALLSADVVYVADPLSLVEAASNADSAIQRTSEFDNPAEPRQQVLTLLGVLRDRIRGAVFVSCSADTDSLPDRNDFFALGYQQVTSELSEQPIGESLFYYSLRDYKQVPGWLNSRFWAHPERWGMDD